MFLPLGGNCEVDVCLEYLGESCSEPFHMYCRSWGYIHMFLPLGVNCEVDVCLEYLGESCSEPFTCTADPEDIFICSINGE